MNEQVEHNEIEDTFSGISSKKLLALSLISALVYGLMAMGIYHWFYEEEITAVFDRGLPVPGQLMVGLAAGILAAGVVRYLAVHPPVSGVMDDYYLVRMIRQGRFTSFDRVQLSIFAGAGEELLFRGTLQPLLGIWFTSVIFVGIHGYFKFQKPGHWLFGGMMFGLSMLLGVLYSYTGLLSAMIAHAVYDMIMLWLFTGEK